MKESRKKTLETFLLIIISFSPLVPTSAIVVFVLLLTGLNLSKARTIKKGKALALFLLICIFVVGTIIDLPSVIDSGKFSMLNLYFPLSFFLGFLISQKYEKDEYLFYLEKWLFVIATFSLLGVFLYIFLPSVVYKLPTYHHYHTSHKTALLFNILLSETGIIQRNAGIAWEPGAFQFLLNLGVYSHVRISEKANSLRLLIYGLALIFTKSTAGVFIFVFITFDIIKRDKKARWFIVFALLVWSDYLRQEFLYHWNYKLFGSYAFRARVDPMLAAYKIGLSRFWGLGNTGYDLLYQDLGVGAWDSFGQIIVRYGIPLYLFITYLLLKILKNDKTLFVIFVVTFLGQGVWFFPVITPFYFMHVGRKSGCDENIMANKCSFTGSESING